jgi:hypothetical protein
LLRLTPEVSFIAVSHRSDNVAAARLYASLGFRPWESSAPAQPGERYLRLDPGETT